MAKGKYEQWLTAEGLLQLEAWARNGLTNEQIASNIGISRKTLQEWISKYSDICDTLKKSKEVADIQVENALFKSALGYEYTETTRERIVDTGQKDRHGGTSELTEKQWEFAKMYFNGKCCYCGNYGDLTKDHVKPLNEDGKLTASNVVPCCKSCNSSKKANEMLSWYQKQPFYDKSRVQKIYDYIDFVISLEASYEEKQPELIVAKEVTKHVQPNTTAQIFWLKNRKPAEWRDRKDIDANINMNKNPYEGLTREQLLKIAGEEDG